MSVPSMEELVETFLAGHEKTRANLIATWQFKQDDTACVRDGLLAVLDRLKPVVAEAWRNGYHDVAAHSHSPEAYATRIIDIIKGA